MIMRRLRTSGFGLRALSRPGVRAYGLGTYLHGFVDPVEKRHCRQTTGRTRLGLAALTDRADEFDVLAIECRQWVKRDLLALAVGHRIAIHLVRLLFADIPIKA